MLTIGDGVYGFTLDPYVGEFVLTHNRIQVCACVCGRCCGLVALVLSSSCGCGSVACSS